MGNYYILDINVEPNVVGVRDGCAQAEIQKGGFRDKKLYDKIINLMGSFGSAIEYEPDFNIELQYLKLKKSAKITDFMLFAPILLNCPFLISKKTKELLEKFNLCNHGFYPADVYTKEKNLLNYYLFFCKSLDYGIINFEKSIIFKGLKPHPSAREPNKQIINVNSLSEYKEIVKESIIQFDRYVLTEDFDRNLDIFMLGATIFVSEKLASGIIDAGLLGADLEPAFGDNLWWKPTLEVSG